MGAAGDGQPARRFRGVRAGRPLAGAARLSQFRHQAARPASALRGADLPGADRAGEREDGRRHRRQSRHRPRHGTVARQRPGGRVGPAHRRQAAHAAHRPGHAPARVPARHGPDRCAQPARRLSGHGGHRLQRAQAGAGRDRRDGRAPGPPDLVRGRQHRRRTAPPGDRKDRPLAVQRQRLHAAEHGAGRPPGRIFPVRAAHRLQRQPVEGPFRGAQGRPAHRVRQLFPHHRAGHGLCRHDVDLRLFLHAVFVAPQRHQAAPAARYRAQQHRCPGLHEEPGPALHLCQCQGGAGAGRARAGHHRQAGPGPDAGRRRRCGLGRGPRRVCRQRQAGRRGTIHRRRRRRAPPVDRQGAGRDRPRRDGRHRLVDGRDGIAQAQGTGGRGQPGQERFPVQYEP